MFETSLNLSQDPLGQLVQPTTGPQGPGAISEASSFASLLSDSTAQMLGFPLDLPVSAGPATPVVITPPNVEAGEALKTVKPATTTFTVPLSVPEAEESSELQQKPEAHALMVFVPPDLQGTAPVRNKEGVSGATTSEPGKRPVDIQEWLQMRNVASSITIPVPIPAQPLREPFADNSTEIVAESVLPTPVLKSEGQPEIDLEKFEVRKLQFTLEPLPEQQARPLLKGVFADSLDAKGDTKPSKQKAAEESTTLLGDATQSSETHHEQPIAKVEAPEPVRTPVEPPPPPPVARQVSMDVGEADSQVHVVIRERNGDLEVRFDTANERLRRDLEGASPMLVHDLERGELRVADLDFSSFGSATESDRQDQQQQRSKKNLKSGAVFAELDKTSYSETDPVASKSL